MTEHDMLSLNFLFIALYCIEDEFVVDIGEVNFRYGSLQAIHAAEHSTKSAKRNEEGNFVTMKRNKFNCPPLPAKTLWNLSASVHWKQKRSVAVTAQARQKFIRPLQTLFEWRFSVAHADCVQNVVVEIWCQFL